MERCEIEQSRPQAYLPSGSVLWFSVLYVETTQIRILWGVDVICIPGPLLICPGLESLGLVGQESLIVNKQIVKAEQHKFKKLHFFSSIIMGKRRLQSRYVLKLWQDYIFELLL